MLKHLGKSGDRSILLHNASLRFSKRPQPPKRQQRAELRADAMGQIARGWMGGPFPRSNDGTLIGNPAPSINLRFRFPVAQSDMIRDCDDFTHAHVKRFRHTTTPISRPSWGHIAFMMKSPLEGADEWSFGKTDNASAYKIWLFWFPI